MVSEVDRQFMIENDLAMLRTKSTQHELYLKSLFDIIETLKTEVTDLKSQLCSVQADIRDIKAKN